MTEPQLAALREIQPSQLYVSASKLAVVLAAWTDRDPASLEPVPVKQYGERLVMTDGHTRSLAAHRKGLDAVVVVTDEDDLDDEAYEICIGWCLDEGIRSVADLADRVVDEETYERLWLDRCRKMHRDLGRD